MPSTRERLSRHLPLLLVVAVAAGIRLLYFSQYLHSPLHDVYRVDHLYYRTWGLEIAAGDWGGGRKVFEQGPLYAYFLGLLYTLLGTRDSAVLAVQLLLGAATPVLVFAAARRLLGPAEALVAGLLAAVYGPALLYEALLMKSFLAPLLTAAALYAVVRHRETGQARWLVSGAAVGLLVLKREIHLLLLAPMAAAVRGASWRRRALHLGVLFGSFLLAIAPFTVRNLLVTGEFVPTTTVGGEVIYLSFGPYADGYYRPPPFVRPTVYLEHQDFRDMASLMAGRVLTRKESSDFWFRKGLEKIRQDPGRILRLTADKLGIFCNDFEVPDTEDYRQARRWVPLLRLLPSFGWVFGFGVVGLVVCLGRRGPFLLLPGFFAAYAGGILLTHNLARYRIGVAPVLILAAALGAVWTARRARAPDPGSRRRAAAAAACALALTGLSFTRLHYWDPAKEDQLRADQERSVLAGARLRDGIPGLRASLRAEPGRTDLRFELAQALDATGKIPEAMAEYRETLRRDPRHAPSWWRLADLLQTHGRPLEAIACREQVVALEPQDNRARRALGTLYARLATDPDQEDRLRFVPLAERQFREAARLAPADPVAPFLLGRLHFLLGARDAAREELSAAVSLDPGFTDAWYLLDQLPGVP
jgi:tetratricopeptide (TPR) repeat protein